MGILRSLELETPSASGMPASVDISSIPVGDTTSPAAVNTDGLSSPKRTPLRRRPLSPKKPVVVRPAIRLCSAGAGNTYNEISPVGEVGSTANIVHVEQWRRPWSPVSSPAMLKMKREGFAVHDVGATVGGGFYLEQSLLSWGRLQGHRGGAVWECGTDNAGDFGDRQQCREYSEVGEFSTASMPPRFAAFLVGGILQVCPSTDQVIVSIDRGISANIAFVTK